MYRLAYSPCPNDTYIFAALANGMLDDAPAVAVDFYDIDRLNQAAQRNEYELIKVSYGAIPFLADNYRILRAGGAMGRACGPLLVARPADSPALFSEFASKTIAIPGERTTAYALLRLALGKNVKTKTMRFDKIIGAVANGDVDAGLIIHESRFTYRDANLIAIADLGEWWETHTLLPIPLGAILVRNDVPDDAAQKLDDAIRRSLAFARAHEDRVMPYVKQHATEMSEEVMHQHIALYVNGFTEDVGKEGMEAVQSFFNRCHDEGVIDRTVQPRFV